MYVIFSSDMQYFEYMIDTGRGLQVKQIKNKILRKISYIHRSVKLNRKINMPFKNIWYKFYLDYNMIDESDCIFLFFEGSQYAYDEKFIHYLRVKYPNGKFVFRFTNTISEFNEWCIKRIEKNYDLIISMDYNDCQNRNWMFFPNTYNLKKVIPRRGDFIYDVFFLGNNKGRHDYLLNIYDNLSSQGIKCLFIIGDVDKRIRRSECKGIMYLDKPITYSKVLEYITESKCILEVVQEGQNGSTLRTMEAIAFEKRLITNDIQLTHNSYYNSENMLLFHDIDEIDIEFIQSDKKTVYNNRDIISDDRLFTAIDEYFVSS